MLNILAAAIVLMIPPTTKPINYDNLHWAICQVENGSPRALGGVPCWTQALWCEAVSLPYECSTDPQLNEAMTKCQFLRYADMLEREKVVPSIWLLAECWNKGFSGKLTKTDYGQRVENLYYDREAYLNRTQK